MIVVKIPNPKKTGGKAARASGLAEYIREPERENGAEKCIHTEAENFLTTEPAAQVAEMIALSQEAVKSKDPIDHWVLSWKENERPTIEQAREAVKTFVAHCGLEGHQVIWGLHDDTENRHLHIEINRVNQDTLQVTKINKGFDLNAAHQAIALIEHRQGWSKEKNARYEVNEAGELLMDKAGRPLKARDMDKPREPSTHARNMELQTGEKSAQRIGIEQAAPIIEQASSWKELHEQLATRGMQYERKGSGAIVHVGDVPVKASDVSRKASLSALQKRLGAYQPPQEINPNDYHHHTAAGRTGSTAANYNTAEKPHPFAAGKIPGNRMRNLSECNLARHQKDGQTRRAGVLHLDVSADRQRAGGLRRDTGRDASRKLEPQPIKEGQPGWKEYQAIKAAKSRDTTALQTRHETERLELYARLKTERVEALAGDWKGKGADRNAQASIIAAQQAAEKMALQQRHKEEREALQAQYAPLPQYREWKDQQHPARQAGSERLWQGFQAWKREIHAPQQQTAWQRQQQTERDRKAAIKADWQRDKARIGGDSSMSTAQRRAALSVARMVRIETENKLREQIAGERAEHRQEYPKKHGDLYQKYLEGRAEQGNEQALAELRRKHVEPAPRGDRIQAPAEEQGEMRNKVLRELDYRIHKNEVIYSMQGKAALVDTGQVVKVLQASNRDVIANGLRLAQMNFGDKLSINGTPEFRKLAVEIAVEKNLRVAFTDPTLEAYRQQLLGERKAAMEARAIHKPQPTQARADKQTQAKNTPVLEVVEPPKAAPPAPTLESRPPKGNIPYKGEIQHEDDHYLYQDVGRKQLVRHDKAALAAKNMELPQVGDTVELQYKDGALQHMKEIERGRDGHGR